MSNPSTQKPNAKTLFPRGSTSFFAANPAVLLPSDAKNAPQAAQGRGKRGCMNKTESEFAMILEAQKRKGEILRYEFEGITLRFAGVRYTPDFLVIEYGGLEPLKYIRIKFIEIKGGFIGGNKARAVERFRHARTYWPEFQFEMWQRKDGSWTQIM